MRWAWLVGGVAIAAIIAAAAALLPGGGGSDTSASAPIPGAASGELSDEQQAQLEQFQACLSEQGVMMPQPGEGPLIDEAMTGDVQGALEECRPQSRGKLSTP